MMRMNLSIPSELRDRMRAFDDRVNWSKIAADAFRAQVERMEARDWLDVASYPPQPD